MGNSRNVLSRRFLNGLELYKITLNQLKTKWKYCGGEQGRHLSYFDIACPGEDLPEHEEKCVCGHRISENCYITDGEYILILGNCCVRRFLPLSGRTCKDCSRPHRNRKDNLCLTCRRKVIKKDISFIITFD